MSAYFESLQGNVRSRYIEKLNIVNYVDPYTLKRSDCDTNLKNLPTLELIDIVNYFTLTHSFYTGKQVKAFKSLEAYKYCKAGFVKDVYYVEKCGNFIVIGEVKHSQRMNEKPLNSWLIILPDGTIDCAHCNCMAGLGEVCSHVASIAFYLLLLNENPEPESCTSVLSKWPVPLYKKTIAPQKIKDVDWGKRNKSFDDVQKLDISPLKDEDLHQFLRKAEEFVPEAVIFSIMQPYAKSRIPQSIQHLPKPLNELYNPDVYVDYSLDRLQSVEIPRMSDVEREVVYKETMKQSKSKLWFKYRAGRITGSLFKCACNTSIDKPSLYLIKKICYPMQITYKTTAMTYGIDHENIAMKAYENYASKIHANFIVTPAGLCISEEDSIIAATPDGIIQCECCGRGCVEIKCPYRMEDPKVSVQEFAKMKNSCIVLKSDGSCVLNRKHAYFYQIQLQMHVTKTKYCDFIVWSKKEMCVERVLYDANFMQIEIEKVKIFHSKVIIPELLVKWFSKSIKSVDQEVWCECKSIDDGRKMIRCSNEECNIKWFHYQCVNIKKVAENTYWFCRVCSINIFGSPQS